MITNDLIMPWYYVSFKIARINHIVEAQSCDPRNSNTNKILINVIEEISLKRAIMCNYDIFLFTFYGATFDK